MQEAIDALTKGDIWGALERTLGAALAGFYALVPIYGISIILFTVAVRLLVWPLTSKQAKSMIAMQRLQPEIKKLQAKYKGDRQKLNEETMKFYQENKINPLSGCLPLVVQMPILFALFRVFAAPRGSQGLFNAAAERATTGRLLCDGAIPKGVHGLIPSTSALRRSLDCGVQTFLGMDLAKRPADFIHAFPTAIPYVALVALVVVTGYWQSRQMAKRTPSSAQNDQMKIMSQVMPFFLGFVTYTLSAGLGVYFAVGNVWQIGQQEMIFRQQQKDAATEADAKRARRRSGAAPPSRGEAEPSRAAALMQRLRPGNGQTGRTPPTRGDADEVREADEAPVRMPPSAGGAVRQVGSRPAAAQRSRKKRRKKAR